MDSADESYHIDGFVRRNQIDAIIIEISSDDESYNEEHPVVQIKKEVDTRKDNVVAPPDSSDQVRNNLFRAEPKLASNNGGGRATSTQKKAANEDTSRAGGVTTQPLNGTTTERAQPFSDRNHTHLNARHSNVTSTITSQGSSESTAPGIRPKLEQGRHMQLINSTLRTASQSKSTTLGPHNISRASQPELSSKVPSSNLAKNSVAGTNYMAKKPPAKGPPDVAKKTAEKTPDMPKKPTEEDDLIQAWKEIIHNAQLINNIGCCSENTNTQLARPETVQQRPKEQHTPPAKSYFQSKLQMNTSAPNTGSKCTYFDDQQQAQNAMPHPDQIPDMFSDWQSTQFVRRDQLENDPEVRNLINLKAQKIARELAEEMTKKKMQEFMKKSTKREATQSPVLRPKMRKMYTTPGNPRYPERTHAKHEKDNIYSPSTSTSQPLQFPRYHYTPKMKGKKDIKTKMANRSKNIDPELHLSNPRSEICIFCEKQYKRIVNHYKTWHESDEVLVSRLSQQMADQLHAGNSVSLHHRGHMRYLKAMCYFCETDKDFPVHYWLQHIRSHTGEYVNVCYVCGKKVCFNTHCGITTAISDDFNLRTSDLKAYICRHCNFIQIDEENIRKHIVNEHEVEDAINHYQRTVLLPAWDAQYSQSNGYSAAPNGVNAEAVYDQSAANDIPQDAANSTPSNDLENYGNQFKFDTTEENDLLGVMDLYRQSETWDYHVRPWIDGDYASKPFISLLSQFALYKCMHENCIFATDAEHIWEAHMAEHIKLIDVLDKRDILSNDVRRRQITFRECPYCVTDLRTNTEVLNHMDAEHRRCIFQCMYCYYRSNEMDYMVCHYEKLHAREHKHILVLGENRYFDEKDFEVLKEGDQYLPKFKCQCEKEFRFIDQYWQHLVKHHSGKYICRYCNDSFKCSPLQIQAHLLEHGFSEFQCVKCESGANDINEMRNHMTSIHPSSYMFVYSRQICNRFIYMGETCTSKNFTLYECPDVAVLNNMMPKLNAREQHNELCLRHNSDFKRLHQKPITELQFPDGSERDFYITYKEYLECIQTIP